MPKPSNISITDFITNHKEDFVAFETWLADDLTDLFIIKNDLNREYTAIIVDIDEDDPIGKAKDGTLTVRLNGRFYMPREDRNGKSLNMDITDWVKVAQEWFDKNEIEVHFDTEAKDLLKFTAFVGALDIPGDFGEESEGGSEEDSSSEMDKDESESGSKNLSDLSTLPEPGEEGPEEGPGESEGPELEEPEEQEPEEKPEESKKELKEFEDALGL
jgi:hypothetical protein